MDWPPTLFAASLVFVTSCREYPAYWKGLIMLMERWDPHTGPGTVMLLLTLVVGVAVGRVLFRAVVGWVESSLDISSRDARHTVCFLMPIGVGIILLLSWLLGLGSLVELPLTFSVGVGVQASVFSRRHSVSLRRAWPFSLAIAAVPIAVVAAAWCTILVAGKLLMPYWATLGVEGIE